MNVNGSKLNSKMPLKLVAICCLFGFFVDCVQAQHVLIHRSPLQQQFVQPNVEYSPWSPIDLIDYSLDAKINKVRSIQSSPLEIQSVPRGSNRRNFESAGAENNKQQAVIASTFRPAYKRRTFTTSTTIASPTTIKVEGNANRFKNHRRNSTDNRPATTSRRTFTPRTTSENSAVSSASESPQTTKPSPIKRLPLTRGSFKAKEKIVYDNGAVVATKDDEDNYPEHFKQLLLKNKEVNTQQTDKSVLKKPLKQFKPTERLPTTRPIYPTRQNRFTAKITSTSTTEASATTKQQQPLATAVTPKRPLRSRPRPTEKTRANIGSTLQEPPTAKTTAVYATRAPLKQSMLKQEIINTPTDEFKQIDPPVHEYFPRTSAIGSSALKYSSRFRNTDITGKTSNKIPSYQATVPSITTTPALDLNDIDLERWREILPLAAELINSDAEIMTQSPSQTVSIYEALAEILSKPTESLSFLNNKSTDRTTLVSEAPISSTTSSTTTSTTTTSTTPQTTTSASQETSKVSTTISSHPISISISSTASIPLINNTTTIRNSSTSVNIPTETSTMTSSPHTNPSNSSTSLNPHITPSLSSRDINNNLTTIDLITTTIKNPIEEFTETETLLDTQSTSIVEKISIKDTTQIVTTEIPIKNSTKIQKSRTTRSPKNATLETQITRLPRLDLMTRKVASSRESLRGEYSTPSVYPVYRPTFIMSTTTEAMSTTVTTTELPQTTVFDYDKLATTILEISNPAPFKNFPKSLTTSIPVNERVIPLKKYPLQKENERFAILSNNTVVRLIISDKELNLPLGILPDGTVVKKLLDGSLERVDDAAAKLETTNIDPNVLISPSKSHIPITTTEQTKTENASHILELLQKYQNETDALVKSPNIFSLAKKTHHDDETHETQLEFDNDLVIIDEHPEETIKTAFSSEKTDSSELPTTPFSVDSNSVSIFPNGHDFSSTFAATTTTSTKPSNDSIENEISFDDKDFLGLTLEPIQTSTEKIATRVTSSFSSTSLPTTTYTTEKTTTETPQTTTETATSTTTENFIEKNYKALQQLLGKTVSIFSTTMSTTEMPSTTQEIVTTSLPPSTTTTIQQTTPSTTTTTTTQSTTPSTTISITQPSTTTTVRKFQPTTRFTKTIPISSSTTPIRYTTVISSTSAPSTSMSELITSTPSTNTLSSVLPISTTHRFSPLEIPSNPPTKSTNPPKRKSPYTDADDLDFLRQLSNFLNRGSTTTRTLPSSTTSTSRSITSSTTTTTTTTSTTTTTTVPPPPSTTTTLPPPRTTTTTLRIIPSTRLPTTYSDADDLNFLKNLREYAKIINLTTERTNLAQKILELAMNRTSKSYDSKQSANTNSEALRPAPFVTTTTQSPIVVANKMTNTQNNINMMSAIIEENKSGKAQTKLSPQEIEKTKQMLEKDLVQYNKDLQLLSLLIGRPLTDKDVAKFATANLNKPKTTTPLQTTVATTSTTQYTSSTSPIPAFKPLTENEAKFLQALQLIQTTRSTTTSTTTELPRISTTRSRSQEAVLAELLAQQGIGPGNINQAPIQKILLQLQAERSNRDVTTTIRPFSPMPPLNSQAPRRPIIDGLSWLWRTWQETAPGRPRQQTQQVSQTYQQQSSVSGDELSFDDNNGDQSNTGGLSYSSNQSPLGPNGFLGAAIGVTRAVTRFLGVALTGAGQVLQVALSGSSATTTTGSSPLGLFGGSRL